MSALDNTHTASTSPALVSISCFIRRSGLFSHFARLLGLTAEKFNRLVLSKLGFALSYVADTRISIIIYEFRLLPLKTSLSDLSRT
jgi:hypothetical protein